MRAALLSLLAIASCTQATPEDVLGEGARYLDDPVFRRAALERSLANHDNTYSRQRLASYGLVDRGWDALPVWVPRSRILDGEDAAAIRDGGIAVLHARPAPTEIWSGARPSTMWEWIALGRTVFFTYPLRAETIAEWALSHPAYADEIGVEHVPDGAYPGLAVFVDIDGRTRVGITCGSCHSAVQGDAVVAGRARRRYDYGALRIAYHAATGVPVDPELVRRMKTWGPGRADVTEDDEDPVAIPDLWGLAAQSAINQAGTIHSDGSVVALAIRQETQLLTSNHQRVRPPRELALALALYVRSLQPPERAVVHSAETERGARLFAKSCVSCHDNAAYGGTPVAVAEIGTDPALAMGRARGTGTYRPPALLDVRNAAPYLHHGAVSTLEDLLSPARLTDSYVGPLGPGAVPGHTYGMQLDERDRHALVAFLQTL